MSWQPEIDELQRRRQLAEACGGAEAVAKHHAHGKLTVRERVAALADPGSFREVGKLAGKPLHLALRRGGVDGLQVSSCWVF